MRQKDREIGVEASGRADVRRIGEKLLLVDELEDTLAHARSAGEPAAQVRALERRLDVERRTIDAMESRGDLRYDEIARAMEVVDRSG